MLIIVTLLLLIPATAGAWEPDPTDKAQVKAAAELEKYQANDKVRTYIEQGYGYAILPNFFRVAAGVGVNYGNGFVIEQNALVGKVWTIQATIGFTYGAEAHSQILIFRNQETLEIFQGGRFEFQGRASGTLLAWGGAADPGFLPDVAIFSRTKGGLMVELAAMVAKYNYKTVAE